MVSELMRSTKELTEVYGIEKIWLGPGPFGCRPRYSMYVEMSPPNRRHSEPRNNHIANLLFDKPVEV
jgi:hypothetical protein